MTREGLLLEMAQAVAQRDYDIAAGLGAADPLPPVPDAVDLLLAAVALDVVLAAGEKRWECRAEFPASGPCSPSLRGLFGAPHSACHESIMLPASLGEQ